MLGQLAFERGDQRPVLGVDRADAAEMSVVLGDLFEPFSRNVAAAGDVFQKWHDVVHALGAAEREDEERIVRRAAHCQKAARPTVGRPESSSRSPR